MMEANAVLRFNKLLEEISSQEELKIDTIVNKEILQQLEELKSSQEKKDIEELFTTIEKEITELVDKGGPLRSVELLKKRSLPRFHRFRTYKLSTILLKFPSLPTGNPFVWQMLAEKLFLSFFTLPPETKPKAVQRDLDIIEKNAIRYASGYVLRKLQRRYSKDKSVASSKITECISKLIWDPTDLVQTENVVLDDFEAYTRVWLTKTDRGGLLHVTDETFWFFCEVETVIYDNLMECFEGHQHSISALTSVAIKDPDVQYIWSVLSDMDDEDDVHAQCLLKSIIEEWITLRGHSLRNHFMEEYKLLSLQTKAKKRSLRKELKRSESSSKQQKQ